NLTKNLYEKMGMLESYAKSLYRDTGIDVTAPDLSDPYQLQAHQVWLQAIADVQYTANALKNAQSELSRAVSDPNRRIINPGQVSEQVFDPATQTYFTQIDERVQEQNKEAAKNMGSTQLKQFRS